MNTSTFEKVTLENGLRIILTPMPAVRSVTAIVLCGAGSRYEKKETNGVSHFLEHMFFKGTQKRPTASDISHALDEIGADYNAFTGKETTGYHIKAASQHLPLIIDMLADMLWNSKFDGAEIEKERGVIIEELNLYEDTPMRRVAEIFEQVLWGDQPLGWDIGGRKEVIRKIQRGDFVDYISARYVPENMVLSIAGNFKKGQTVDLIKKYYGHQKSHKVSPYIKVQEKQKKPACRVVYKKTDQAHLCLGFRGIHLTHPDRYNAAVLATILGGGMSSRLFINVREKRGLAYYVRADNETYSDTGAFVASAGVDLRRIEEAVKVILAEFAKIAKEPVSDRELKKAKEYIKGRVILSWEDSRVAAVSYGTDELVEGRVRTLDEELGRIDAVKASDIKRVARSLFTNARLNLSVIGPFKDKEKFAKILKI